MMNLRSLMGRLETADYQATGPCLLVRGWVLSRRDGCPTLDFTMNGRPVMADVTWHARPDVYGVHRTWNPALNPTPGFVARIPTILLAPGAYRLRAVARHGKRRRALGSRAVRLDEAPDAPAAQPRPLPHPAGRVFFLHIPKTAGTSLNAYLAAQIPPSDSMLQIERAWRGRPWQRADFEGKRLVAGHVMYDEITGLIDLAGFFSVTVLRDPVKQIQSQLAFHYRIAAPDYDARRKELAPVMRDMIGRLVAEGPVRFLSSLSPAEAVLFDNPQTRRFIPAELAAAPDGDALAAAMERLAAFNLVGLAERMPETLMLLAFHMRWPPAMSNPRLNVSTPSDYAAISGTDPATRELIGKLTARDRRLYAFASTLFDRQMRNMMTALGPDMPPPATADNGATSYGTAIRSALSARAAQAPQADRIS